MSDQFFKTPALARADACAIPEGDVISIGKINGL